jgi:hypothetical protein
LGYTVIEAENGADALVLAEAHGGQIDVVVADVVMPQMGGPEFVSKLRAKRKDFAVIFISGYSQASSFSHPEVGTATVLLNKPFSVQTLAARIQELLPKNAESASAAGVS